MSVLPLPGLCGWCPYFWGFVRHSEATSGMIACNCEATVEMKQENDHAMQEVTKTTWSTDPNKDVHIAVLVYLHKILDLICTFNHVQHCRGIFSKWRFHPDRKTPSRLPELTDPHGSYAFDPQASEPREVWWNLDLNFDSGGGKKWGVAFTSSCRAAFLVARLNSKLTGNVMKCDFPLKFSVGKDKACDSWIHTWLGPPLLKAATLGGGRIDLKLLQVWLDAGS